MGVIFVFRRGNQWLYASNAIELLTHRNSAATPARLLSWQRAVLDESQRAFHQTVFNSPDERPKDFTAYDVLYLDPLRKRKFFVFQDGSFNVCDYEMSAAPAPVVTDRLHFLDKQGACQVIAVPYVKTGNFPAASVALLRIDGQGKASITNTLTFKAGTGESTVVFNFSKGEMFPQRAAFVSAEGITWSLSFRDRLFCVSPMSDKDYINKVSAISYKGGDNSTNTAMVIPIHNNY